ncbi:MAG: hypothetical protein DMF95_19800 [Acidobacteria bacterium]|nr:MAG: hypothetical protein DMF95_19800 [Acidobacteriota bacterium]
MWAPDSRSIYLQANDGTFGRAEHMFEQPVVRLSVADGRAERLGSGPTLAFSIGVSSDGRRAAYKSVDARAMGDVVVMDVASGHATKITDVNPELRELALGELKPVKWRSFDGMEIWGLLLTPTGLPAGGHLPTLVYVHGGPGGGFTYGLFPQFMHIVPQVDPYPTAAMAGSGFAVLFPMPRGGAGYGEAGQRMIVNAWGEADYKDIMAGVDKLVADGVADPDRLGVMGASYGGFMTNWIVTQTGRFKAASAGASLSDLSDTFYLSEGGEFMIGYFKRPWENRESYTAHSPLTFADRVTTPLLIQHGDADPRAPIAGAWKFYRTLKAMGKTVELDIYPRGGPVLRELALGELKPVKWRSFDGMEIWGLLLTPTGLPAGGHLPTLVYVHGGPGGGFTYGLFPQFMHIVPQVDPYPTAAMAGSGFAVLFPMPRGGAGYGEAGQRMIVNAWGEADYKDIMAGVDKLVADGVADPDRLGVMGASYGGFMTNWIVTQTGRFKAASAGASLSDLSDTFYLSEGGEFMIGYFKRPWENRESYTAHSPLTFADRVTTPLLIQHGDADPRAPIAGAWKFYRTLKAMGKTVELDIYPRGGHVLREPMQQREQMRRNLEWFTKWVE